MLDKIKGLKKYTDCSMPTNENELRQKESVAGYNQAIEDVVKIFSIYDVSQRSELLIADFIEKYNKGLVGNERINEDCLEDYFQGNL
jgi:hypothetical protein